MRRVLLALPLLASAALLPGVARAQVESREGIILQNQILQLRQELDLARRGGGYAAPQAALPPPGRGGSAGGGELVGALLERVGSLEEEVRRLRGQSEQAEFRNRSLQAEVEKLRGDLDYRLGQVEGGGGGRAPQAAAPAPQAPAAPQAPTPRPPERALSDGQAALNRRDFPAAEAAAREVLAARNTTRAQDAQLLLGDSLVGRRDFQNAALAYDDAYRRNRQGGRAAEALVGLATAFNGFNARREACSTLDDLRTEFPRLGAPLSERAAALRRQAGCR